MTRHEIEEELDGLYKDLNFAYNADEETYAGLSMLTASKNTSKLLLKRWTNTKPFLKNITCLKMMAWTTSTFSYHKAWQ